MYQYLLVERSIVVRLNTDSGTFERYDHGWVRDDSLREIYTGDVQFRMLTEDEAKNYV